MNRYDFNKKQGAKNEPRK